MRYWDSSAVFTLLVQETPSPLAQGLYKKDADIITWWATEMECMSAICRLERAAELTTPDTARAIDRLDELRTAWQVVQPSDAVRSGALRLLRVHDLRAADALQLAAGLVACGGAASKFQFVTFDKRLAQAATKEGFDVLTTTKM